MTASEIEYPSTNATHDKDQPNNNNGLCQCPNSEGNSNFYVLIFDMTILDDFPASQTAKKHDVVNICCSEMRPSVCPKLRKLRVKFLLECLRVSLKARKQGRKENRHFFRPRRKEEEILHERLITLSSSDHFVNIFNQKAFKLLEHSLRT